MADPCLSTSISRRSMLAGSAGIMTAPVSAFAILPAPNLRQFGGHRIDARLLTEIEAADDCLADYLRSHVECIERHRALSAHPDFPRRTPSTQAEEDHWDALLARSGIIAADARCDRLYDRYQAALAAAFARPAHTIVGVYGKLRLAVTAVKQEQTAGFDTVDCVYLGNTLDDLRRLVLACGDAESPRLWESIPA